MEPDMWPPDVHAHDLPQYAAIGYLCHQWNHVEFFIYSLATDIMHMDRKFYGILFRHLGLKSAQEFINDYAAKNLTSENARQIAHANSYADRCRINRNYIVHGNFFSDADGIPKLTIRADKNRKESRSFPVSLRDMHRVAKECEVAGFLLIRAQLLVSPQEQIDQLKEIAIWPQIEKSLLSKPPLPKLLSEIPQTPEGLPLRPSPPQE